MDKFKKIAIKILFPNIVLSITLFPVSLILMLLSMLLIGMDSIFTYISYALAFYSLTIFCLRIPNIISFFKRFKNENKYMVRLTNDVHLRMNIILISTLIINIAYALLQLAMGIYHKSFWFYSMSVYYILLALIRLYLSNYTRKYKVQENIKIELKKYRFSGYILLLMNLTITVILFFIIYWNRTFYHNEITTIALAAYTFLTFTMAIINFIKYRKYNSPVYSAAKSITLVAACVSMITLTTTMLTTFGSDDLIEFKQIILLFVGIVVALFINILAIQIIVSTTKKLKEL